MHEHIEAARRSHSSHTNPPHPIFKLDPFREALANNGNEVAVVDEDEEKKPPPSFKEEEEDWSDVSV